MSQQVMNRLRASLEDSDEEEILEDDGKTEADKALEEEAPTDEDEGDAAPVTDEEIETKTKHEALVMDSDLVIGQDGPITADQLTEIIEGNIYADDLAESMEDLVATMESFIAAGTCTAQVATMMHLSVESLLARHDMEYSKWPSMEAYGDDWNTYCQVSTEGIAEFAKRLRENIKSGWKSFKDDFTYNWKTRNEKLVALDRRLREAKSFVTKRKADIKKLNYKFEFGAFVKLFTVDGEVVSDITQAINSDMKAVGYMLGGFQNEVNHMVSALAGALSGTIASPSDVDSVISKVAAIKNPGMHLGAEVKSGFPFMGNYGLQVHEGKTLKGGNYGELGRKVTIVAKIDWKDSFKDLGTELIFGNFAAAAKSAMNRAHMNVESLEASLDAMTKYVAVVRNSMGNSMKAANEFDKVWENYAKLTERGKDEIGSEGLKKIQQIEKLIKWQMRYLDQPFQWAIEHAFYVLGNVISLQEHLARRLK